MRADTPEQEPTSEMQKVTLRIPEEQIRQAETLVESGEFPSRSEAIRAALRQLLDDHDAREKLEEQRRIADGGNDD